jgi:hypothetical protein
MTESTGKEHGLQLLINVESFEHADFLGSTESGVTVSFLFNLNETC